MSEYVRIIDPTQDPRWDEFVNGHPFGSVYQLSSYKEVIAKTFSHTRPYYIVYEQEGKIKAGVPFFLLKSWLTGTRLVSLPFSGISDPLVDSEEQFDAILQEALHVLRESRGGYIDFRVFKNTQILNHSRIRNVENACKYHIMEVKDNPDDMMRSFHKKCVQKRIQKAERSELKIDHGNSDDELQNFFKILLISRKNIGLPPQPFLFFRNLKGYLGQKGIFQLVLARWNDRVIGGLILLKYRDTIIIDYAAQDKNYVTVSPIIRLFWDVILMASREGYKYIDLGRSHRDNEGLIDFKRKWGCKEYDLPFSYYSDHENPVGIREESFKYKIANRFFKLAPAPIAKIAGSFLYKHID